MSMSDRGFNIKGNHYRLVVKVRYQNGIVVIESEGDSLACEALISAEDWSKTEIMAEPKIRH